LVEVLAAVRLYQVRREQAIASDDPATIKTVLKDAVPEFGSNAA
jgi:O-antigen biosynthesis protein WbqV